MHMFDPALEHCVGYEKANLPFICSISTGPVASFASIPSDTSVQAYMESKLQEQYLNGYHTLFRL
jgi:hypothetical protein